MPRLISGVWPVFRLDAGSSASLLYIVHITYSNIGIPVPYVSSFHVTVSLFSLLCLFHKKTKCFNLHIFTGTDDNLQRLPFLILRTIKNYLFKKYWVLTVIMMVPYFVMSVLCITVAVYL